MADKRQRIVKASLLQPGPGSENIQENIDGLLKTIDEVCEKEKPDFVMCNELSVYPYFPAVLDKKYFEWAEPIPGPLTGLFSEKAKKYEVCLILGIFERTHTDSVYYNSLVILGPDGNIISGTLPDGTKVLRYAKSHIPWNPNDLSTANETFYFTEGIGWPIFDTPKARIGLTLCFDRHFPEPYRILTLQGAKIIFTPSNAMGLAPERGATMADMYLIELQVHAMENFVWHCTINKGGTEDATGKPMHFYGNSAIFHPTGQIVARGPTDKAAVISYDMNLEDVHMARHFMPLLRTRRPELYSLITKATL